MAVAAAPVFRIFRLIGSMGASSAAADSSGGGRGRGDYFNAETQGELEFAVTARLELRWDVAKAVVVCADGTGNTSSTGISNVYRLIELLALDDPRRQVVVYDQGIGTPASGLRAARALERRPDAKAFHVIDGPVALAPLDRPVRLIQMALGLGLKRNVRQLYRALAERYDKDDTVYLFGFSRGAFTVRALAGLIHRCGLPQKTSADFDLLFQEAWRHFTPMQYNTDAVDEWRRRRDQRDCVIHFLGVWETVKSYGGLRPILLPHLRHNPIVRTVRHAIALDEKRGWYNVTTWGRLDQDRAAAMTRVPKSDRDDIETQDIREVWFRGCHSDVGGGDEQESTAIIARQWMLGEACDSQLAFLSQGGQPLAINDEGRRFLARALHATVSKIPPTDVGHDAAIVHESLTRFWALADLIPRREIDNSGTWPCLRAQRPGEWHAYRSPELFLRDGAVAFHESVGDLPCGREARIVGTRLLPDVDRTVA